MSNQMNIVRRESEFEFIPKWTFLAHSPSSSIQATLSLMEGTLHYRRFIFNFQILTLFPNNNRSALLLCVSVAFYH